VFSPLLFADWRAIARTATVLSWLAVLILAVVIAAHLMNLSAAHFAGHLSARR
jgi:hypothetical protein